MGDAFVWSWKYIMFYDALEGSWFSENANIVV